MNFNQSQKYQKSDYLVIIRGDNGKSAVYHSLFNNPKFLDESVTEFLGLFSSPLSAYDLKEICEGEVIDVMKELSGLYFIVPVNHDDERVILKEKQESFLKDILKGVRLSRLELAISDACNLGCLHCMHFKNNELMQRTGKKLNMSIETAKKGIDSFVDVVKKAENNRVRLHFGNGEPLLNWKTIQFCLEYCNSFDEIDFTFAVNTNLTLLTKEIAEVLKKYNVKISTSLDGLQKANDLIRVYRSGKGTFDTIVEKFHLLKEIDYPLDGFSVTVISENYKYITNEILDFAKEMGIKDVSMDFDLVDTTDIPVAQSVDKIIEMRRYATEIGLNFYGTWETPYRVMMLNSWLKSPYAFCPAMEGTTIEFGVDDSLKVCGHTNTKIADHISEIFSKNSLYYNLISSRLTGNNSICVGCSIEGACAGQCHVIFESSKRNPKLMDNMCNFMKLTTKRLLEEDIALH